MMKIPFLVLALLLAAEVQADPGAAAPSGRSKSVSYADLDLGSATAESTLEQRIRGAAHHVCDIGGMQTMDEFRLSTTCYRTAVKKGINQMQRVIAANRSGSAVVASAVVIVGTQ